MQKILAKLVKKKVLTIWQSFFRQQYEQYYVSHCNAYASFGSQYVDGIVVEIVSACMSFHAYTKMIYPNKNRNTANDYA